MNFSKLLNRKDAKIFCKVHKYLNYNILYLFKLCRSAKEEGEANEAQRLGVG